MPLSDATARSLADAWSDAADTPWSPAEVDQVTAALVVLSSAISPHLVPDVPLTDDQTQRYLMGRLGAVLDDWLGAAATDVRRTLGLGPPPPALADGSPALGLRSATLAELDTLPGIGPAGAREIARLVGLHPDVSSLDDLEALDGIGAQTVDQLRPVAYLDQPRVALGSPRLLDFARSPSVPTFVRLLDAGDLELVYGDGGTHERRGFVGGGSIGRLLGFLALVTDHARRTASVASGVLASDAADWLARTEVRSRYLDALVPVSGGVLVDDAYVASARTVVESAVASIRVLLFLGTAAAGSPTGPGPLELITALEARAAAGVSVRVILDRDIDGEPYGSLFINQPLLDRLAATAVEVKFDEEDTLLHSKVLVVDDATVVVGSHNWTRASFNDTHELSVLLQAPTVAAAFAARFDALWAALP